MVKLVSKNLTVGQHTIKVTCSGYDTYEAVINVSSGGTVSCVRVIGGSCSSSARPGIYASGNRVTVYMKAVSTAAACPTPTASFTYSPSSPVVGTRVTFNGKAGAGGTGHSVKDYIWQYGDGASGRDNYHTYTKSGTFTVRFTVMNTCNNANTVSKSIRIGSGGTTASSTKTVNFTIPDGASLTVVN